MTGSGAVAAPGEERTVVDARGRTAAVRLAVNRRARRISVRIDPIAGVAVVTAPHPRHAERAFAFAEAQAGWIAEQIAKIAAPTVIAPGAIAPVRGVPHIFECAPGRGPPELIVTDEGAWLRVPATDPGLFAARCVRFLRALALSDLEASVARHSKTLSVAPRRVAVRDTRSRWGSCTANGALAFSWRLIFAPPEVLDYVAAHEVAHLLEMNHSPRFWAHVARCTPDHQEHRAWLRAHGRGLLAIRPPSPGDAM